MRKSARCKLAVLLSHPVQYFAPLFRRLAERPELDFRAYYGCDAGVERAHLDEQFGVPVKWDIPLLDGYDSVFLENHSPRPRLGTHFWGVVNGGLPARLRRDRPDVLIVHGWAYFTYVLGFAAAKAMRTRVWLRTETPLNQEMVRTGPIQELRRELLARLLVRRADRCLYLGKQNRRFYEHLAVEPGRLTFAPYCVDNDRFRRSWQGLKKERRRIRREIGISDGDTAFLFVGKLTEKKRPVDLLRAFLLLDRQNARLIFVGDGHLRGELESMIRRYAADKVLMAGFRNQSELARYYAAADVFVLPSGFGETWGLVVNEALNFDLPVVVSDMVGCAEDLVEEGRNGFTYPCGDVGQLADRMARLLNDPGLRQAMGARSGKIVTEYSYDTVVDDLLDAVAQMPLRKRTRA